MPGRALLAEELETYSKGFTCSTAEIRRLWKRFNDVDQEYKGYITKEDFAGMKRFRCNPFACRIACLFSPQGDGRLSFQNFLEVHSAFHERAPLEEKIAWAFALWDFNGDDKLDAADMRTGLKLLANGSSSETSTVCDDEPQAAGPAMFDDQPVSQSLQTRRQPLHADLLTPQEISQVLERMAREIEPVSSGISFEEFEGTVSQLPNFVDDFRLNT